MTFIKRIALGAALLTGLSSMRAQAGYIVSVHEVGSDVVATGSGPIDTTGLIFLEHSNTQTFVFASVGTIVTGPAGGNAIDVYGPPTQPGITGPANFGSGSDIDVGNGSGDVVGLDSLDGLLSLPAGYVSGTPLADIAIYANQTFSSLGTTPGTYNWFWGTGADQQFTVIIGTAIVVPAREPASASLLGTAVVGLLLAGIVRRSSNWRPTQFDLRTRPRSVGFRR